MEHDRLVIDGFIEDTDEISQIISRVKTGSLPAVKTGEAFSLANELIENDINQFGEGSKYVIFFISDGRIAVNKPLSVSSLVDRRDNVYVSAGYYGPEDLASIQLLENIAEVGNGNFVNFQKGQSWDISTLLLTQKPDVIPWSLKEFLVYNLNAGFCLDGKVDVDSDSDGMCDRDELTMNSVYSEKLSAEGNLFDPTNRFSFGDGYGDFFHWLRFRYPGKTLPNCVNRSDEDFDLLTACEENEIRNSGNGNDLRGDPKSFDTDKDGIIDGIETFVYFASQNTGGATRYTAALDPHNLDNNPDGEENVSIQIRQHRNPWFKDAHINLAYDTTISPYQSAKNDCYWFSQSSLPIYQTLEVGEGNTLPGLEHGAGENSIMIYYIQVLQSKPAEQGVFKYSFQKLKDNSISGLKVRGDTFNEYIPPKRSN